MDRSFPEVGPLNRVLKNDRVLEREEECSRRTYERGMNRELQRLDRAHVGAGGPRWVAECEEPHARFDPEGCGCHIEVLDPQ